jgi:hypothetical protein
MIPGMIQIRVSASWPSDPSQTDQIRVNSSLTSEAVARLAESSGDRKDKRMHGEEVLNTSSLAIRDAPAAATGVSRKLSMSGGKGSTSITVRTMA